MSKNAVFRGISSFLSCFSRQTDPLMKELTKNVWDFFRVLERGSILNQVQMSSAIVTKYVKERVKLRFKKVEFCEFVCRTSQFFCLENMVDICKPIINMLKEECEQAEPGRTLIFFL